MKTKSIEVSKNIEEFRNYPSEELAQPTIPIKKITTTVLAKDRIDGRKSNKL